MKTREVIEYYEYLLATGLTDDEALAALKKIDDYRIMEMKKTFMTKDDLQGMVDRLEKKLDRLDRKLKRLTLLIIFATSIFCVLRLLLIKT